jgi:hypothetical protein
VGLGLGLLPLLEYFSQKKNIRHLKKIKRIVPKILLMLVMMDQNEEDERGGGGGEDDCLKKNCQGYGPCSFINTLWFLGRFPQQLFLLWKPKSPKMSGGSRG